MGVCDDLRMSPYGARHRVKVPFTYQLARLAAGGLYAAPAPRLVGANQCAPTRVVGRIVACIVWRALWRASCDAHRCACLAYEVVKEQHGLHVRVSTRTGRAYAKHVDVTHVDALHAHACRKRA